MPETTDLTIQTPVEIDTQLFELLQAEYRAIDARDQAVHILHVLLDKKEYSHRWGPSGWRWTRPDKEVLDKAAEIVKEGRQQRHELTVAEEYSRYQQILQKLAEIAAAQATLNAEFTRRGGWTRAFLVDNPTGHIHRSMQCSTCHVTTQFHWFVELSGADEDEIVEQAGEKACTTCYRSAPVDVLKRPSKLEGPALRALREAQEERAAEKAARDAKKAEKAITNPDGTPLRGKWGTINTLVTAWRALIDDVYSHRAYNYQLNTQADDRIITALVAKTGLTSDEIWAEVNRKVAAKGKREGRRV